MNLHLFLDVVAWIWGVIFTVVFVIVLMGSAVEYYTDGKISHIRKTQISLFLSFMIATLCWAWIVAS